MAEKKKKTSPGKHWHETKFQERTNKETLFFVMTRMDSMHLILRRISRMINVFNFLPYITAGNDTSNTSSSMYDLCSFDMIVDEVTTLTIFFAYRLSLTS